MTGLSFQWAEVRLAALLLLVLYAAVAVVLLFREITFLRKVDPPTRRLFVAQDILIQVCVLLVLLPCAVMPQLPLTGLFIVTAGFALLWLVVIWTAFARYAYVARLLKHARKESEQKLKELVERLREEEHR